MSWREAPPVERARYHAARLAAWARRTRPAALAVRGAVWSSGFVAVLLVAAPLIDPGPAVVAAALLAALGAGFPRSGWVGGLEVAVVLVVAGAVWLGQPVPIGTVAILAALLYLHHSAAALAAHLRTDALVSPAVLRRWAGRTAAVLAGSLVIGAGAVTVPQTAPGWSASGLMAVAAAATVLIAGTIAYLGRAHRGSRPR